MVHAIKMGWMKPRVAKDTSVERHKYYLLWNADDKSEDVRRIENPIPAPKPRLPGHAESYNPPPEYAFSEREINQWNRLAETPYQRKFPFIPQRFSSLRAVPAYDRFARERFVRCLDLYLCPRAKKMRLTIQPEDLVPQLPKPRDLQPFPTVCSMIFKGHKGLVRTISHDPSGQFFISGSDDQTLKGKLITDLLVTFHPFSIYISQYGRLQLDAVSRLLKLKELSVAFLGARTRLLLWWLLRLIITSI